MMSAGGLYKNRPVACRSVCAVKKMPLLSGNCVYLVEAGESNRRPQVLCHRLYMLIPVY